MHAEESRRHLAHWAESDLLKESPKPKTRDALRTRVVAIREELKTIAKIVKTLSIKLKEVEAADLEHDKETVVRPSESEPVKRPK